MCPYLEWHGLTRFRPHPQSDPSAWRKPAASSSSSPGVRMVTTRGCRRAGFRAAPRRRSNLPGVRRVGARLPLSGRATVRHSEACAHHSPGGGTAHPLSRMPVAGKVLRNLPTRQPMTIRTIFETCRPRADVLHGTVAEADFAADLAQVVTGRGSAEYVDPARFLANSYPTRGLKNLLANVCRRLSGAGGEAAAIFASTPRTAAARPTA